MLLGRQRASGPLAGKKCEEAPSTAFEQCLAIVVMFIDMRSKRESGGTCVADQRRSAAAPATNLVIMLSGSLDS